MSGRIELKRYDYDEKTHVPVQADGEIDTRTVAHGLDVETMAALLSDYTNAGGKSRAEGERVGRALRSEHRAIQTYVLRWLEGVIRGLSEQDNWDPRNAHALAIAKRIRQLGGEYATWDEQVDWDELEDYG